MLVFIYPNSMTFTHFFESWCQQMENLGVHNIRKIISYQKFLHSWYAFFRMLDVVGDDLKVGMECKECGPYPDEVIVDGTSVGFQEKFVPLQPFTVEPVIPKFR